MCLNMSQGQNRHLLKNNFLSVFSAHFKQKMGNRDRRFSNDSAFDSRHQCTTLGKRQQAFHLDQESCPVSNSPIGDVVRQVEHRDIQRGFSLETCSVFPHWRQGSIAEAIPYMCPPAASNLEQQVLHLIQLTAVIGNFKTRLEHLVPASDPPILSMLDGFEETPQKEATQHECCPKTILMIHDDDEKNQDEWEFNKCGLQLSLKYVANGIAKSLSASSDSGEFRSWSQGFGSDESGCIAAVASRLSHSNRSHPLRSRWHLAGKPLLRIWSLEHVLLMCTAGAYGMCYHHCSTVAATAFELFHCCFLLGMLCSCFIQFLAQVIVLGCGGKSHQGQWNATLAFTACLESLDVCFALLLGRPADIYCIL